MTAQDGLICRDEVRREFVRRAGQNGLDHVEVSDDHLVLTVSFLAKAPAGLGPGNISITGGQQVTGITAVHVKLCADDDPDIDDCIQITVSQPGDASCYRLCLVEADAQGRPHRRPAGRARSALRLHRLLVHGRAAPAGSTAPPRRPARPRP